MTTPVKAAASVASVVVATDADVRDVEIAASSPLAAKEPAEEEEGSGFKCCMDFGYEYEEVLTSWEIYTLDRIEGAVTTYWCKPPPSVLGVRYHKWEGMRPDVPERYQRWEGIRERNVILGLGFMLSGHARKLPNVFERIGLLLLYMAVWFWCYSYVVKYRGEVAGCQQLWVEQCVPRALGGGCEGDCAESATLALTPRRLSNFHAIMAWEQVPSALKDEALHCVSDLEVDSLCSLPMCARGEGGCDHGLCTCVVRNSPVNEFVKECMLYMFFFKVLYWPFYLIQTFDLKGIARCIGGCGTVFFFGLIMAMTLQDILSYEERASEFVWHIMRFLMTFAVLCVFEVVKAFFLGFVVGSYVVQRYCHSLVARIWKYLLC